MLVIQFIQLENRSRIKCHTGPCPELDSGLFQHPVPYKMLLKIKGAGFRTKFGMTTLRLFVKKGTVIFLT